MVDQQNISQVKSSDWRPSSQDSARTTRKKYLLAPEISTRSCAKGVTFEGDVKDEKDQMKKRNTKLKTTKLTTSDPYDADREEKRKTELRERHIKLVDDMHKLKEFYKEEYMDGLMEKVKRQRKDIQRQNDELLKKIEVIKKQEREASRHLKKRSSRSSLHTDNTFLDNLHKTRLHKICILEAKLWNEGTFKTIGDSENFWDGIIKLNNHSGMYGFDGSDYNDTESEIPAPYRSKVSSTTYQQSFDEEEHAEMETLGLIREDTEPSRMSAVSGTDNIKQPSIISEERQKSMLASGIRKKHPKVIEFEQRFKKVELPKLSAYTLDLSSPKEDPEISKLRKDFKRRASMRHNASKQLNKMYEMSLAHLAATRRLLEQNEDLSSILQSPSLSDVLGIGKRKQLYTDDENAADPQENDLSHQSPADCDDSEEMEDSISGVGEQGECRNEYFQLHTELNEDALHDIKPYPLTLEAVMEKNPILDAKRSGVFWHNYGKFLPSIAT